MNGISAAGLSLCPIIVDRVLAPFTQTTSSDYKPGRNNDFWDEFSWMKDLAFVELTLLLDIFQIVCLRMISFLSC